MPIGNHRIIMAAVEVLLSERPVKIKNAAKAKKSCTGFFRDFKKIRVSHETKKILFCSLLPVIGQ